MLRRLSKNANLTLSILLIFIGLCLLSFNYFDSAKKKLFNQKNIELFEQTIVLNEEINELNEEDIEEEFIYFSQNKDDYIGILEVPSVNIKRGFVSMESEYNSINYNVMLVQGSTMPNVKNGNLILAAHRGNSSVSFFDKLYLLKLDDIATVTFNNKKYTYKLVNYYYEARDGSLTVRRDANKTVLTLITCTRGDKKTQTIFIFELVSIE